MSKIWVILNPFNLTAPQYRVEFSYRNTFQLPNLRDLTPYATQASASALRTGNSQLRTAYEHRWRLSVSYLRAAQLELTYQDTRDALVDAIVPQLTSYAFRHLNLESSRYVRALLALPLPLVSNRRIAWTASTYFAQQWQSDKGAVLGEKLDEQQHSWYLRHRHTLSWKKAWYFDLGYTYYSALRYGLFRMQPQGWWEAGASHNVGNWRIAVNVYDLFNTTVPVVSMRRAIVPQSPSSAGGIIRRSHSLFPIRGESPR